jgi:hypothetical protein
MPLHLIKLSVGAQSLDDLARWQQSRKPPLKHQTRNMPRRAADIVAGGSIYWVMSKASARTAPPAQIFCSTLCSFPSRAGR